VNEALSAEFGPVGHKRIPGNRLNPVQKVQETRRIQADRDHRREASGRPQAGDTVIVSMPPGCGIPILFYSQAHQDLAWHLPE
jgi:hypothetical protein